MAWEPVQLRSENGEMICDADRETILASVERALLRTDRDPDVILKAASVVGRRVGHIKSNLQAYAARCIYRATRRSEIAELTHDELVGVGKSDELPDPYQNVEQIENRILVRELLETLSPQDRDIFIRHMSGHTFARIDNDMDLKPRTAEFRFRLCKDALRALLRQKSLR